MASAGGKEVGRVSIRVVPNTDGFREATEKGIAKERLRKVKVPVEPDFQEGELKQDVEKASKSSKSDVKIDPDFDGKKLKAQVESSTDAASGSVEVDADVDTASLGSKIKAAARKAEASVSVEADLDDKGLYAKAVLARAKATAALREIKASVDIQTSKFVAKVVAATKAASRAARVRVKMVLDSAELRRDLSRVGGMVDGITKPFYNMFGGHIMEGIVRGFTKFKGAIAIGTIALAGMGTVLAPMISSAYEAAVALGRVGGAIIPSVITSGALAFGALNKAFSGFGKALSASDYGEFNEAVADMGPSARKAASGMFSLKQAYLGAVSGAQENFWSKIKTDFSQLTPVAESVGASVARLAGRFGNAADEAVQFAASSRGIRMFKELIENSSSAAGNLFESLTGAVPGIMAVGAAGSDVFRRMSGGIKDAAESWSDNMVKSYESGELQKTLDESVVKLQRFGSGIKNVGRVTGGVFKAMNKEGQKLLAPLDGVVARTADWVESAKGQKALENFFSDIGNVVSTLAPVFGEVAGTVVKTVVPAISEMITAAGPGLQRFGEAIGSSLEKIAPQLPAFGKAAGAALEAVSPLIEAIAPAIPSLLAFGGAFKLASAGAKGFKSVKNAAKGIGAVFGGGKGKKAAKAAKETGKGVAAVGSSSKKARGPVAKLGGALKKMPGAKGLAKLGSSAAGAAGSIALIGKSAKKTPGPLNKMSGSVAKAGSKMKGFGKAAGSVGKKILPALGTGLKVAGKGISRFIPVLGWGLLAFDLGKLLFNNWDSLKGGLSKLGNWFTGTAGPYIKDKATQAWDGLKESAGNAWDGVKEGWSNFWTSTGDWLVDKWEGIKSGANSIWNGVSDTVSNAWDGVKEGWGNYWSGVGDWLSDKWNGIKESASSTWDSAKEGANQAWEGVQELWSTTWDNITTGLTDKWTSIKETATEKWADASTSVSEAWNSVGETWSVVWDTIGTTLSEKWESIKTSLSETWTTASQSVSTVWDGVGSWWSATWTGISSSLSSIWGGIKSSASSTFSSIRSTVSNAWSGVQSSTSSAWSSVTSAISSAISSAVSAVSGGVSSIVSSVASMASGVVSTVAGAMSSFVSAISSGFSQAVSLAASLPGQVVGAMGNLGGLLVASGRSLVQGFVNGIRSMIGAVRSAASSVVSAARSFFPFSPAKEGPFSGRGYTTHSGRALVRDFGKGMLDEKKGVAKAATDVISSVKGSIDKANRDAILQPVLESNAEKIADAREREREAEKDHVEKLAEIRKSGEDVAKKTSEQEKRHAEEIARIREDLNESLEAPDYSQMDRSFKEYWIGGLNKVLKQNLDDLVNQSDLAGQMRRASLDAVNQARSVFGNNPLFVDVEANVNSDHFEWAVQNAIDESEIHEVPVNFVIENLKEVKDFFGMGDGVISRAIDAAMEWDPNNSDARRYREESKNEVHYHVEDMNEAIRLEKLRERKQMMRMV